MTFRIVERKRTLVAGLPVRSPRRALGQVKDCALDRAWAAVLKQPIGWPLASAYTDHAAEIGSYYTQTVGYECASVDEATPGHIVSVVPAGWYAMFSSMGSFPDVFHGLWDQVREAEESGRLDRTFTGDFESYPNAYRIDLYIAVRTPCPGGAA